MQVKQSIYIPFDRDLFLYALKNSNFDLMDKLGSEMDALWTNVFQSIESGKFHIAWYDCHNSEKRQSFMRYALHRSTKNSGLQLSCMEIREGNVIPTSDRQYTSVNNFLRDGLPSNINVLFA